MIKLSVIIPVYNERESIGVIIDKVLKTPYQKEVIIVDDASTDGTRDILKNHASSIKDLKVCYHEKNMGKTAAIRTAIPHVTGDIVVIQDGDLEYNPSDYKQLIEPIVSGEASVVYGSRFLKVKKNLFMWHWFLNKFLGRHYEIRYLSHFLGIEFLNLLAFLFYGVRTSDIATGYKVFRYNVIKNIKFDTDRFEFCYEVTAKIAKKGIKIKEVQINYHPRSNLQGKKITWKDGIWASWTLLKYRFKN